MKHLLSPDGLLLIEVPDSSKFLAARDYSFLWEEHSCYFVEDSLHRLAETAGFRVRKLLRYPGALEDALVAVLEVTNTPPRRLPWRRPGGYRVPPTLFQAYRDHFGPARKLLRKHLAAAAGPDRDGVALFGIGHHAIMFANAFDVADMIALAVDDDPDKAGFFPPGFRVPVVGSQALLENARITTCLFAVAPHIQAKVQARLAPLAARGVKFRSIYAALEDSIVKDLRVMTLVQKSPELFLAEGSICEVGESEIQTLKAAVKASAKRRARINAHPDGERCAARDDHRDRSSLLHPSA